MDHFVNQKTLHGVMTVSLRGPELRAVEIGLVSHGEVGYINFAGRFMLYFIF